MNKLNDSGWKEEWEVKIKVINELKRYTKIER